MIWEPGQKLNGDSFEIIKPLGEGGYSITYLARDILHDKQVVIKIPRKILFPNYDEPKYIRQFQSEAKTLAKVSNNSRHIVNVREFFEEKIEQKGRLPCIVMDFIEGKTLMERVQDNGFLPEEESLKYIRQVGEALVEVHKQDIIHQDANPKNIMIQPDGNAILIDFGIAKSTIPSTNTTEYGITEHFAPYEQCYPKEGDKRLPTSDIYSLAATFYYAVTCKYPTKATERKLEVTQGKNDPLRSPKQINSKLSKHINDAILWGMALDKQDRPQSMGEWLQKLEKPIVPKPAKPIVPTPELKKINPFKTSYYPLLPKMKSAFPGGSTAGEWRIEGIPLLKRVADNLDIDTSKMREIDSIPSPWSKSLQFLSAILNFNHPSRDWLIAQYRGFLAVIALSENLSLSLQATRVDLQSYQNTDFGRCLSKLLPSSWYCVLSSVSGNNPWSELFLFELEENVIGLTSPATLVAPVSHLKPEVERRIPWVKNGLFTNPIGNGLTPLYKEILAAWLYNLRNQLLKEPVNRDLAGSVASEIERFYQDLGVSELRFFQPSADRLPFEILLYPQPLDALIPIKKIQQPSNVEVLCSPTLTPKRKLYLIAPIIMFGMMERDALSINVIDSLSLAHFDRNLHSYQYRDSVFLTSSELFSDELFYAKTKELLPGTWLDRKLNAGDLTILLPLNPILKEYFTSEDLEKSIQLASCNTPEGPGIRVTLGLILSGFEKPIQCIVYKDFPLKAINEITQSFPILALWPNVPPGKWREYFVFVELTEAFGGVAFSIEQPTERATHEISQSGQEKYLYWKCDRHPEILSASDQYGEFLGLLPLNIPKFQANSASTWTVGVEVESSFTNIHIRKGNSQLARFNLRSSLLRITKQLEGIESVVYREFFIPEFFLPEGNNLPLPTMLTTRGWNETIEQIPSVISQARIYQPSLEPNYSNEDYIKTNIKLQQVEYLRPFLGQLLRLIAAQATLESVDSIRWIFSYPLNLSRAGLARYTVTWEVLLEELRKISGQSHELDAQALCPNNIAMAKFFADILNYNLVNTTCIDFSTDASEVSIWQENCLVYQSSIPYGVRNFFHRILKPNLAFIGDIFCLPFQDGKSLRRKLAKAENLDSALDIYLRINEKEILLNNYIARSDNPRNREFRTLLAFSLGGFYHYLGLVQKYLNQENLMESEYVTAILIGGSGSRFLNWLSPSGCYTSDSEINILLQGILIQASGLMGNYSNITFSDSPGDEVSSGLFVPPYEERLRGLRENENHLFLGEDCRINGKLFAGDKQLKLDKNWETIEDFEITSFSELEKYINNFDSIIADDNIKEIGSLRNFANNRLLTIINNFQEYLQASVKMACLRKRGPIFEFEPEPPFLLTLRCLIDILAEEWSRS